MICHKSTHLKEWTIYMGIIRYKSYILTRNVHSHWIQWWRLDAWCHWHTWVHLRWCPVPPSTHLSLTHSVCTLTSPVNIGRQNDCQVLQHYISLEFLFFYHGYLFSVKWLTHWFFILLPGLLGQCLLIRYSFTGQGYWPSGN